MTDKPIHRTQKLHWFVEIGTCDGCGMGRWESTTESVSCETKEAADTLRDEWVASGKLKKMHWGELRPAKGGYGMFRIRAEWIDTDMSADLARAGYLAGLQVAALYFQEQGEIMQGRLNRRGYGTLPVKETEQIISDLFRDARAIRALAADPTAVAAIVAQVMEKD